MCRTYVHLMSMEDSALRKRLWSLFCTRLSHQLSLAGLSDLKSVHKRGSATHHVCLFLAALLPLTACLSFCINFSCPPFPSQPQRLSISHIFSHGCACPRPVTVEQITARCTPRCPFDSLSFPLAAATPPLPPPIFFFFQPLLISLLCYRRRSVHMKITETPCMRVLLFCCWQKAK